MKVGIMQPYFLPYIGYFQLIGAVDTFVIYDSIKYTKKGWINRNRFLLNGSDEIFSIPLKKAPDHLSVIEREISEDFNPKKLLAQFEGSYRKAPYLTPTMKVLSEILEFPDRNLFNFIHHSLRKVCAYLEIETPLCVSSSLSLSADLKAAAKVKAICKQLHAKAYLNPIGGTELYDKSDFMIDGIELKFLKSRPIEYRQFSDNFVPWLSILDVMMFNSVATIHGEYLSHYDLV